MKNKVFTFIVFSLSFLLVGYLEDANGGVQAANCREGRATDQATRA